MNERNGVRMGQRVRDARGKDLGKVTALYEWGFAVSKGFPILFRREWVARYDEVRGVREGALVLARSDDDLEALARGGIAPSWRIPAPRHFPGAATPAEAQGVFEEIASGAISSAAPVPWQPPASAASWSPESTEPRPPEVPEPPPPRGSTPSREVPDMRRYADSRGQSLAQVPPPPAVK